MITHKNYINNYINMLQNIFNEEGHIKSYVYANFNSFVIIFKILYT